jgi:CheY-like chemotaxis protein
MPHVLVVDDEPDIRDVIRMNLEAEGYRVTTAAGGDAALQAVAAQRPDAIFLDVLMPGTDGWSVLRQLKAGDAALAAIPVVMVTALSQAEERLRGAIEGAVRYLTKPFHPRDLIGALADVLGPDAPSEEELRRRARQGALESLARIEAGRQDTAPPLTPRVHLTRLERSMVRTTPPAEISDARQRLTELTPKQRELLAMLRNSGGVTAVAEELGTSRSNIYASLRRIVHRLGLRSTTQLLRMLTAGELLDP